MALNTHHEPTGLRGRTPGLAAIIARTTQPDVRRSDADTDEDEWDAMAKRGKSTSRALAASQHPALVIRSKATQPKRSQSMAKTKVTKAGPRDIVAVQFQANPADQPRWAETIKSVVYRSTVGALPRLSRSEAAIARSTKRHRLGKPGVVVYQRGLDSNGRPKHFQSLTNLIRRSTGLPR